MRRCVSHATYVLLVLSAAAVVHAQTVDEVVARNVQATGGDKWKSVNSVKKTGKVTMQGIELPLTVYTKRPNLHRQETILQDKRLVQAFDGAIGWLINPMTGSDTPQEVLKAISDRMTTNDFEGALIGYKEKGHTVELVGKEKIGTTEVHHRVGNDGSKGAARSGARPRHNGYFRRFPPIRRLKAHSRGRGTSHVADSNCSVIGRCHPAQI
jgi:outer membrane lipoprotein-sorting protein